MDIFCIRGGTPLHGRIALHGAKNAALPLLAATLATGARCELLDCPDISDVTAACAILRHLGCAVEQHGGIVAVDAGSACRSDIPAELMRKMRAAVLFLGPLLARFGTAELSLPGGCPIGERPMDYHLQAFRTLGAEVRQTERTVFCKASRLTGARLRLPGPSVGATENAMLAAIGAAGETTIENAAREPEITDLAGFLCACGAKITGAGTSRIRISGGEPLTGATYTVLPDRIETATFLCACAACGGTLTLRRAAPQLLQPVLDALRQSGCQISCGSDTITVCRHGRLTACRPVVSEPYPGFPTDAMPALLASQLLAEGETAFTETIFENRFLHVRQLQKLGADLSQQGRTVRLRGVPSLHAAQLQADDLRGGAALVIAAMCAEGILRYDVWK